MKKFTKLFLLILLLTSCDSRIISAATSTSAPLPTKTLTIASTSTKSPTKTAIPSLTATNEVQLSLTPLVTRIDKSSAIIVPNFIGHAISLVWSIDGRYLYIGTQENGLVTYDSIRNVLGSYVGNNAQIQALAISPDGKTLTAGLANDGSIRFLSAETGDLERSIWPAHEGAVQVLAFHPNGEILASCGDDGQVLIWEVSTGKLLKTLIKDKGLIWGLAFSPDGKELIAGDQFEAKLYLWNVETWTLLKSFDGDQAADLAFSPDGTKIVTAGGSFHEANIWDINTGKLVFNLSETPGWTWAVAYSRNGKYVASAGLGDVIILWDTSNGKPIYELFTGPDFVQALSFNPDGTKMASGGLEVIIWDTELFNK